LPFDLAPAAARMNRLLQHLRTGLSEPDGSATTDGQLLEGYIARRDETAFAALVGRHGPMVWGVCRRLLRGHQDAEDAFQATFLVLSRKAASIAPRHMVGNWLYGVAYQTSLKARALAARRHARERQVAHMPDTETEVRDHCPDMQAILDQELSRLPDKYRAVILLCELEGKTRKEAARQLRVPEGSVAGWLARGRAMLAKRLTRRGVVLSGGSLATVFVQYAASANAPAALVTSTIQAATKFAVGPVAAGAIPPQVVTLTEGVLKSMLLTKLKFALAVVLAAGILGIGVSGVGFQATAGPEPKDKTIPTPANRIVNDFTGDTDLKQLKAEVDRLRAEVESLKKLLRLSDKTATPATGKGKLVIRVYGVKDLIVVAPEEEQPPAVIRIVTGILEPMSWSNAGGPGSIEYFPAGHSLVVNQTAEIHEQLDELLQALRKAKGDQPPKKQ
jgi:RNA polymerase sigma factor (sigma-70 family)